MRARRSSPQLTVNDAVAIWRMRAQGACQHEIAAALRVNQGRVSEVLRAKRFPEAEALAKQAI